MVASALKGDLDAAQALRDTPLPLPKDNIIPPPRLVFRGIFVSIFESLSFHFFIFNKLFLSYYCVFRPISSQSEMFLQNVLHQDSLLKHTPDVTECALHCPGDLDTRVVDLFFNRYVVLLFIYFSSPPSTNRYLFFPVSLNSSSLPFLDDEKLLQESLSGHSSVCGDSDLTDLQYDQSLLENLFYKTPVSGLSSSFLLFVYYYLVFIHLFMKSSAKSLFFFQMSELGPSDSEKNSPEKVSPRKKLPRSKMRGGWGLLLAP